MKCPHCGTAFHGSWSETRIGGNGRVSPPVVWTSFVTFCPECENAIIELKRCVRTGGDEWKNS